MPKWMYLLNSNSHVENQQGRSILGSAGPRFSSPSVLDLLTAVIETGLCVLKFHGCSLKINKSRSVDQGLSQQVPTSRFESKNAGMLV